MASVTRIPIHIREKIVRLQENGVKQRTIRKRLQLSYLIKLDQPDCVSGIIRPAGLLMWYNETSRVVYIE